MCGSKISQLPTLTFHTREVFVIEKPRGEKQSGNGRAYLIFKLNQLILPSVICSCLSLFLVKYSYCYTTLHPSIYSITGKKNKNVTLNNRIWSAIANVGDDVERNESSEIGCIQDKLSTKFS